MTLGRTTAPLGEANFRRYVAARAVNLAGTTMAPVALAFAVLATDDSPSALGVVLAAHSIPLVALLLVGGVIADRVGRATVMRVSNLVAGLSQATTAALVVSDSAQLWQLVVLAAVNGTVAAASIPAMSSVVPQLVPAAQLQQANVLLSMMRAAIAVLGPSVAGALVVAVGPGWALAVDASAWLLSAALLTRVRLPGPTQLRPRASMVAELREGWTVVRTTSWLWVIVLAFAGMNAIQSGAWSTLGPRLAEESIGPRGWGLALSTFAAGLLAMTLILSQVTLRRPLRVGMLGCAVSGLPIVALGSGPHLGVLVTAAFLGGAGIGLFSIGWHVAMQEHIADEVLARAYSFDALGSYAALPVGQLLFGPLGHVFGVRRVILVGGVIYVGIALLTLTSASVRHLSRRPTSVPVP
ncbi:MFS transporter [Nocardioides pacificus]